VVGNKSGAGGSRNVVARVGESMVALGSARVVGDGDEEDLEDEASG
jgi:hypothetical protein